MFVPWKMVGMPVERLSPTPTLLPENFPFWIAVLTDVFRVSKYSRESLNEAAVNIQLGVELGSDLHKQKLPVDIYSIKIGIIMT